MSEEIFSDQIDQLLPLQEVKNEIAKVVIGQRNAVELLLAGILCDGHILLEGVPGVAKTLIAKLIARLIDVRFSRLQFTPDLMPGDVIGTSVFNPRDGAFDFRPGPIFSNIVLIDEINRAPAKTQSALFEVMEERQVTVDGNTHLMAEPFMVIATQNPVEQEGTYRLPEAQLDRFLFKVDIGYPTAEEEIEILTRGYGRSQQELLAGANAILSADAVARFREIVQHIKADQSVIGFITAITRETRNNPALYLGASTRASLALLKAAKALAAMSGRDFVIPEDVSRAARPVLRHRLMLTPEKEMEGVTADTVVENILQKIEVPR